MSRLCCANPHLYLRYQQGLLETDVCLKVASALGQKYPVLSGLLQLYSEPLGGVAKTATSTSSDVVFPVEDVSSKTLDLFVGAMYGRSLRPSVTSARSQLVRAQAQHTSNAGGSMSVFFAQDSNNLYQSSTMTVTLYETVPVDFEDMQNVLFDHIMCVHTWAVIKVQPRHVHLWLTYLHELPGSAHPTYRRTMGLHMLSALIGIYRHKMCPGF